MTVSPFLILSILFPPIGLPIGIYGLYKNHNWKQCIACIAICLATFAYCFVPTGHPDLVTYFERIADYRNLTFKEAFFYEERIGSGNLYSTYVFFWIVAKIGDYHLISSITTFIIYYIGMYITCSIADDLAINNKTRNAYIIFLVLTINYYGIINNIRNVCAFAIIIFAVYRDCYEKKKDFLTLFLYLFAIFFHTSAILFFAVRLTIEIKGVLRYLVSGIIVMTPNILDIIYPYALRMPSNSVFNVIRYSLIKGYRFFNDTSSEWGLIVANSGSYKLSRVLYISLAIIFSICAIRVLGDKNIYNELKINGYNKVEELKKFTSCGLYAALLTIACLPMLMPEYWRFASAMILSCAPIYYLSHQLKKSSILIRILHRSIFLFTPLCMMLWIREFKACDLTILLFGPFISSPIIIFFKDLINMVFGLEPWF